MNEYERDVDRILFTEEEIQARVKELGMKISEDYRGKEVIIVGILKGGSVFMTDLIREVTIPVQIDFMQASSYGSSAVSSGSVKIVKDLGTDPAGKNILLAEDIIDTGHTLYVLRDKLLSRGAESVRICALLDKPSRRTVPLEPDYCGFEVPDEFIIGYGIDYAEKYRNLPYIGILKKEVYDA